MKKYLLIIISAALIALFPIITNKIKDEEPESVGVFNETQSYTVKEYDGRIGIYEDGTESPINVLDTYIFMLPEYDRDLLKYGFSVDEGSVSGVIEDYTG